MKLQLSLSLSLPLSLSLCPSCDTDGQLQSHCNLGGAGGEEGTKNVSQGGKGADKDSAAVARDTEAKLEGGFREISLSVIQIVQGRIPANVTPNNMTVA